MGPSKNSQPFETCVFVWYLHKKKGPIKKNDPCQPSPSSEKMSCTHRAGLDVTTRNPFRSWAGSSNFPHFCAEWDWNIFIYLSYSYGKSHRFDGIYEERSFATCMLVSGRVHENQTFKQFIAIHVGKYSIPMEHMVFIINRHGGEFGFCVSYLANTDIKKKVWAKTK